MAVEFGISIGAKISEYLVEPLLIRPLRRIFCFKTIADDFWDAKTRLSDIQQTVQNEVRQARNNSHVIRNNVEKWLRDVDAVMPDVDRLEDQLKENRSSWCPHWTCHYKFSKDVSKITATMKRLCEDDHFRSVAHPAPPLHQYIVGSSSYKAFMHSRSSKSAFDQIMEAVEKDGVNIIGLYGEAGMGKTMLAKQVAEEAEKQFEHVVMVTVSRNQDLRNIQGVIADFLSLRLEQESVEGRASKLNLRLKTSEKILLILDDIWKEFDLGALGILPSPNAGCKVLLTAQSRYDVPDGLQPQSDFQLSILPEDEAWALFQSIAGIGDDVRGHDGAKNAIAECKGRPKSIMTLGRALRGKSPQWDEALQQLHVSKLTVTEDLKEQAKKLSLRRKRVETEIKMAEDNAEEINEDVENWLIDVDKVMKDVDDFMNEFNKSRYCFDYHDDVTKAEELTSIVQKLWAEGNFGTVSHAAPIHQVMGLSSSADFMLSKSAKSAFNQILEALQKDGVNIVGLYGMGGIGKTTLAVQVQKEIERTKVFDHTIMVTVSQRPEVRSIQGIIADFLNLKLEQETEEGRASKLSQRLKDKKILVILDDLWKHLDLRTIGILLNECKGCKILLTTRRKSVCDSMDCQTNIQLHLLLKDEARNFFKKKACLSDELKLNVLAEQVVEECKGLPIALATVGAALRNKGEDEWREALDNLRNSRLVDIVGVDNDEINAYKCLRLSYDYLTHSAQAQEGQFILLLCALYPEDHKIGVEDLTRYVYGMDLFHRVTSIEDTRRKVRVTIRFLKDSCLLMGTDEEENVKMHDVVRDVILWIGGTEPRERNVFTVRDEADLKELIKNDSFRTCRAISFTANSMPVLSKYNQLVCPNLETILIFDGKHELIELSNKFFEHMKALKVLDLKTGLGWRRCKFEMPQSLHNLTDLRTLMLKNCKCFNSSILKELRNLEILSLEGCVIDCGEEALSGLKKLRLLDLSGWKAKRMFPSNMIETFLKLEELHGYIIRECEVGEWRRSGSSFPQLKLLSSLVALSMTIEDAMSLPVGFSFPNLSVYYIRVGTDKLSQVIILSGLWLKGRGLELTNIKGESAVINICNKLLPSVQVFCLYKCSDLYSLPALNCGGEGFLQNLERLEVRDCKKMERVFEFQVEENVNINSIVHLQFLKILNLIDLRELKQVWKGPTRSVSLCNLTEINISWCSKLTCVFSSPLLATSLHKLEVLKIASCRDLKEIISRGSDDDDGEVFSCCCCFTNLRELEVSHCDKVKTIFPIVKSTDRAHHQSHCRLPNLQKIVLQDNEELEDIFGHQTQAEEGVECPSLQVFEVTDSPKMSTPLFVATPPHTLSPKPLKDNSMDSIQGVEQQLQRRDHDLQQKTLICFSSLIRLKLRNCHNLKQVFMTSCVTGLHQLEELTVQRCNKLEQVISKVDDGKEPPIRVGFENLKTLEVSECGKLKILFPISVALPKLEKFQLVRNGELEHVFGRSDYWDCTWQCPILKELRLKDCPKLCRLFGGYIQNLSTAKEMKIEVGHTKGAELFIQLQGQGDNLLTSPLETLSIWNIQELKCIWHGPTHNIYFANLCQIKVIGCCRLKHIFTTGITRSLPKLEELIVRRCNELEQVIMVEDRCNGLDATTKITAEVGFKNLQVLCVNNCEKLKTVSSIFVSLPKLNCLRLENNAELESLFGQSDCDCTSQWTCLKVLAVTGCPKLGTQFVEFLQLRLQDRSAAKQLEIINLSSIQGVEELVQVHRRDDVDVDETTQLQRQDCEKLELRLLKLEEMGDLKRIWSGPRQNISFSYLIGVRVTGCSRLRRLFTTTMATSLRNLKLLAVERCHDLERVIEEEEDGNEETNNIQSVQQLEFSRLKILRLIDLPKLVNFCPPSCNLVFTVLAEKDLKVEGCLKFTTQLISESSCKQDIEDDVDDKDEDADSNYLDYYTEKSIWKQDDEYKYEDNDHDSDENGYYSEKPMNALFGVGCLFQKDLWDARRFD